jgi:hypothetical protein
LDPNYDSYSNDELIDAREHIDKNAFPERLALLNDLISKRENGLVVQKVIVETPIDIDEKKQEIEGDIRSTKIFLIMGLAGLVYGYYSNTFPLPISRYESIESSGVSFVFTLTAIVTFILNSGITIFMYKKPSFFSHRLITLNNMIKYIGFGSIVLAYLSVMR